jgi:hypothetical protein
MKAVCIFLAKEGAGKIFCPLCPSIKHAVAYKVEYNQGNHCREETT